MGLAPCYKTSFYIMAHSLWLVFTTQQHVNSNQVTPIPPWCLPNKQPHETHVAPTTLPIYIVHLCHSQPNAMDYSQNHNTKGYGHTIITSNEIVDWIINKFMAITKATPRPHIHIIHTTPYCLNGTPTKSNKFSSPVKVTLGDNHLHPYIAKEHYNWELALA